MSGCDLCSYGHNCLISSGSGASCWGRFCVGMYTRVLTGMTMVLISFWASINIVIVGIDARAGFVCCL